MVAVMREPKIHTLNLLNSFNSYSYWLMACVMLTILFRIGNSRFKLYDMLGDIHLDSFRITNYVYKNAMHIEHIRHTYRQHNPHHNDNGRIEETASSFMQSFTID
jgi:hypothetical protein